MRCLILNIVYNLLLDVSNYWRYVLSCVTYDQQRLAAKNLSKLPKCKRDTNRLARLMSIYRKTKNFSTNLASFTSQQHDFTDCENVSSFDLILLIKYIAGLKIAKKQRKMKEARSLRQEKEQRSTKETRRGGEKLTLGRTRV